MRRDGGVVVLTGAGRMGPGIVAALKPYNVAVVGTYVKSQAQTEAFSSLALRVDVSHFNEVEHLMHLVKRKYGRVDALIHMAAPYKEVPWEELDIHAWDDYMGPIANGGFMLGKACGDLIRENPADEKGVKGNIIFVSDWAVKRPYPGFIPYFCAKAAVEELARCLAAELAPHVLVNTIRLGPMRKPEDLSEEEAREVMERTPLERWGDVEPLANALRYLLFEQNFQTGDIMTVDGGRSISYK